MIDCPVTIPHFSARCSPAVLISLPYHCFLFIPILCAREKNIRLGAWFVATKNTYSLELAAQLLILEP